MSPSESSMPLIAFLLFTHARLQDNACAMSHDSYVIEITRNPGISGKVTALEISYTETVSGVFFGGAYFRLSFFADCSFAHA